MSSNKNDHFTISHDWENPCDTAQRTVKSNFFDKIIDQFQSKTTSEFGFYRRLNNT